MAAAVFIPPSPHQSFPSMATGTRQRQPLMSIQNAANTNSPHRMLTLSGSKRTRAVANVSQQENEPPSKKQAIEKLQPVTPQRHRQHDHDRDGGQVFEDNENAEPTTFQKKLAAARDKTSRNSRVLRGNLAQEQETIRQWQKHYRKLFPHFRFYFDSVPADVKKALLKQAIPLGAQEETFFSNQVTHIITGRSIPSDEAVSKALSGEEGTINPSVLEVKSNGKASTRRDVINANDIIVRGLQMKMKVWPNEKLQKILNALMDGHSGHETISRATKSARTNNDLVQVLKNEKLAAAAERDHPMPRELVPFRGPFIYVHDMDEKVKPIMVREYPKVARRQDGEWPQFRSASIGKCPFVEDVAAKRDIEREAQRQYKAQLMQQQKEAERIAALERAEAESHMAVEPTKMDPPRRTSPRKVLRDAPNKNVSVQQTEKPPVLERETSFPPMPEQPPVDFIKPSQMLLVREPSASGIQRSTMTSAIQSQMISSAAATGLKATTSKEVHELKRKVLERTHTGSLSLGSISSSHQPNALTGALRNSRAPAHRAAKSKAQEKLGGIQEEDPYADGVAAERATRAVKAKKPAKREPKPGYCENCHDKYEDFEDHIVSRKHRKFAMTASNWTELDALLDKLQRTDD